MSFPNCIHRHHRAPNAPPTAAAPISNQPNSINQFCKNSQIDIVESLIILHKIQRNIAKTLCEAAAGVRISGEGWGRVRGGFGFQIETDVLLIVCFDAFPRAADGERHHPQQVGRLL